MNSDRLYYHVKEKLFVDLTLTLIDATNEITIDVHKVILSSGCIYFEKLLTNCKEKNSNNITINVPNTYVSYDIIMSFYNQKTNVGDLPAWEHLLESYKCYDFFGLDFGPELLFNLEVPAEGFELLLEVVELVGYNENMRKLINKNIPDDYDLSNLSKELLINMLEAGKSYHIVSGGGYDIRIWNAETGELVRTIEANIDVLRVHYSPDNKYITSGSFHSIKIFDTETGQLVRTLKSPHNISFCVSYSPDNKRIVLRGKYRSIEIWDAKTGQLIRTLNGHTNWVFWVCYSPDNKQIASGSNNIKIWDSETGQLVRTLECPHNSVFCVCYSPDNKYIASGNEDKSIKIWDVETGQLVRALNGHTDNVPTVCYSPDNKQIASGSCDNSIKIWDAKTGQLVRTLDGHTDSVLSVCYSPDNKRIASGSQDRSIKIWDAETGELVRTLCGHGDKVLSVCYSSNYDTELTKKIKKFLS